MRFKGSGIAALVVASLFVTAGEARADNDPPFIVDTTSDSGALSACTVAAGDCSLRGAFANANDGDAAGFTDIISFDPTIFDGNEAVANEATVVMTGSGVTSTENLVLQAGGCFPGPCAAIDGPPGSIAISATNGGFSMNGVAIFGSGVDGLFYGNGGDGLSLNRNWFGLTLNGTVSGNQTGLFVAGPAADVGAADSPENVFAGNEVGMRIFGNGATDIDVLSNRFGLKADGTVAANTTTDIDIAGNIANQAPSNVEIGPFPGNATPACDEGCNVIAAAGTGATPGINLRGNLNPNETSTALNITIQNNHVGVNAAGTGATAGGLGDLIAIGEADNIIVNGNRMAGGVSAIDASSGADGAEIASNRIGLPGVAGSGGFIGMNVSGSNHLIQGNSVGNTSGGAIYLTDITAAEIKDNEVGELGPVGGSGISINSSPDNSTGNAIGSNDPNLANVFGDIGDDAIKIEGDGNDFNQILANIGGDADGLFIDLQGTPGPGNGLQGPNQGVEAPKVKQITAKAISGTAGDSGQVRVYRSGSPKGDFPEELRKLIGTKTVKPDGTWRLKPESGVKRSWVITANQTDSAGNGSELSKGKSRRR